MFYNLQKGAISRFDRYEYILFLALFFVGYVLHNLLLIIVGRSGGVNIAEYNMFYLLIYSFFFLM